MLEPLNSMAAQVSTPHATAPSMAEPRFRACAASPGMNRTKALLMAKYNGYAARGVMIEEPAVAWNDPVSPKSTPGSIVDR